MASPAVSDVPPLPLGKSRCRAGTRRYWEALHTSGVWARLDPLSRCWAVMALDMVEGMERSDHFRTRQKCREELRLTERELGLRPHLARPDDTPRRRGPGTAPEDELDALDPPPAAGIKSVGFY